MSTKEKEAQYSVAKRAQSFFGEAIQACMGGKVDTLRELVNDYVADQPDLDAQVTSEDIVESFQSEGKTLLHIAASSGFPAVVDYVLSCCCNSKVKTRLVNRSDANGFTPLINATVSESIESMNLLLQAGANANAQNNDGATALHFAAGDGSVPRVSLLLDRGADASIVSKSGSCLHWAAGKGHTEAVKLLLCRGVDVDLLSPEGLPAALMAAVAMSDATVVALVEAGANIGHILTGNLTLLHICAEHGLAATVSAITATEMGRKCCYIYTEDGNLPIHLAAMSGDRKIVEELLPFSLDEANSSASKPATTALQLTKTTAIDDIIEDGKLRMQLWNDAHGQQAAVTASTAPATATAENNSLSKAEIEQLIGNNNNNNNNNSSSNSSAATLSEADEQRAQQYKDKGNALFAAKKYSEALEAYSQAIAIQRTNHVLYSNRSACYIQLQQPLLALRDAEVCRHLNPTWAKGCYRLALARFELGRFEDAAVAAFEGCKLDENNEELKVLMQKAVKKGREEHQKSLKQSST